MPLATQMSIAVPAKSSAKRAALNRGTKRATVNGLLFVIPLLLTALLEATGLLRGVPFVFQSALIVTNVGLLGAIWLNTRNHTGCTKYGWIATAISLSAIAAAVSVWVWTYFTSSPIPFKGVLEFLYIGSAVLFWPAMVFLRRADKRPVRFNIRTAIDVLVTVVSIATLVWYFLLVPYTPEGVSLALFGSEFLSPALQLVMLSVAAHTLLQSSARQPSHLYAIGILCLIGADVGLMFIVHDATAMNILTPLVWSAGMVALYIDIQRAPTISDPTHDRPLSTANSIPYVMATLAIATLLLGDEILSFDRIASAQAYLIGLGLLAALLVRQIISLRDSRRLIKQLMNTNRELFEKATTDHLTGLLNRGAFTRRLEEFVLGNVDGYLLFIDINHFKAVNDTYGHAAGDMLLQSVANRIRYRLHDDWIASRAGGDEFMAALPGACPAQARAFSEQLSIDLAQPHYISSDQAITVEVAIGAAHYPDDGTNLDTVIDCADQRMYEIKRSMKATTAESN